MVNITCLTCGEIYKVDIDRIISGFEQIRDKTMYKTERNHHKQCWEGAETCDICYIEYNLGVDWEEHL